MDDNGISEVRLAYFGTADPSYYGINYVLFDGSDAARPESAIYAISVQYLDAAGWTKKGAPLSQRRAACQ